MKPDDNLNDQNDADKPVSSQQAAANVILTQIETIYDKDPNDTRSYDDDPYDWTHSEHSEPQTDQWKKYHSAWQDYYQKYYEGYYAHHYAPDKSNPYFAESPESKKLEKQEAITEEVAIKDLREKLLSKISESAKKVRKSRHFKPILSGLIVVLISLFIQYNGFIFANVIAYVSPGKIDIQNIIVDPNTEITVGPEPRLIIPKINVDVPVTYDIGNDYDSLRAAMSVGVAHFAIPGASSHPGQVGNTVISGHSSNDLFATGDYKFIFAQLEKLSVGDSIYANYQSKRYTYVITGTNIVGPTDTNALVFPATKPVLTLLTCTPVGTAQDRLLVFADQISPNPNQSVAAPEGNTTAKPETMPGKEPTFFEWLFGQRG